MNIFVNIFTHSGGVTYCIEVMEEAHAVWRWGRLHWELQEGLHVQVRLDHGGGPQERRHGRSRPVNSSCNNIHQR